VSSQGLLPLGLSPVSVVVSQGEEPHGYEKCLPPSVSLPLKTSAGEGTKRHITAKAAEIQLILNDNLFYSWKGSGLSQL